MDYDEAYGRLDGLGTRPALVDLERTADGLEREMRTGDADPYLRLMLELCRRLGSYDLGDWDVQDRLVRKYARLALGNAPNLPLDAELGLLDHLTGTPPGAAEPAAWTSTRRDEAGRWLSALGRLEREVDDAFDPGDLPAINVAVPGGGLPAGTAVEHIQDPRLRQEYQQAVTRNRERADRYAQQVRVRRLRERYRPVAEEHIVDRYSRPPFDDAELGRLLAEHLPDATHRTALAAEVRRRREGAG
jgi:hypothetical protein